MARYLDQTLSVKLAVRHLLPLESESESLLRT